MTTDSGLTTRERVSSDVQSEAALPHGRFYAFEGIDGAGKSTVANRAFEVLTVGTDREVVLTSEPTDSWLGDCVRHSHDEGVGPISEALLFVADRASHTERIRKWLEEGTIVLSDRYYASTLAYQGAALKPLLGDKALEWLKSINEPAIIRPDLTFLLVIPPAMGMKRLSGRNERTKFEKLDFLREVDKIYRSLAEGDETFVVIDASRPIEEVTGTIVEALKSNL
ncbi:MAG: dTMP kinase [Methanomassiliicoccales archaeon]|jgi:dTMP kinase